MFSLRLKVFNQHFYQLNNLLNSYIFLLWNAKFQRFAFFISRLIVLFAQNRSALNDMDYMLTQLIRLPPPTHTRHSALHGTRTVYWGNCRLFMLHNWTYGQRKV